MWSGEILVSLFCGFLLYLVYLASRCLFQVQEGHVGVLVSCGKALHVDGREDQLRTLGPGLHWKWPWQTVHKVSMMEQMIDLSGEQGGTTAMASDGTMLRLDSKLRFTPQAAHLHHYLFSMERPVEHVKGLFTCLLRNEIANFDQPETKAPTDLKQLPYLPVRVGSYAAIRRDRRLLNQHIQEFCRAQIGDRYGVRFDGVDLTDILPPDELAHSLNSVMNAQSEAQRLLAQTEAECEQRLLAARKGLAIARARARAVEDEIGTMGGLLVELQRNGTLDLYVERRRNEVLAESRISYIKRPS
ncbi:SPFH domain-containing protein [Oligoflexus tunisiensis]|uniref:SPFH domain-containing protein n=1 Tax=Oligoflexus tunisiensis TaxID=708132 RepID=UPI00159F0A10|nr:SPFH domain-containing protein [Oligoflexus tunisiensis]